MRILNLFFAAVIAFSILSCSKPNNFLYLHPDAPFHSITQKVREVTGSSNLDIFWAIGGMTEQQSNFRAGINTFMSTFTLKPYAWRMAVCSSNSLEQPYLGMPNTFDNTNPSPTATFVNGVMQALDGQDDERIFDPIVVNLTKYPGFIRPQATLAVVMTNDAHDSSINTTTAAQMMQFLKGLKGGNLKKVVVYGIFGSTDLNCNRFQIDEDWSYAGSEFEALIKATGGQVYSLCDTSFGVALSKLGDDLYQRLDHPRIVLDKTPDPASIHVFFHGKELAGGPEKSGGIWYYDVRSNAVIFYNLDFAKLDTEEVTVQFSEDTGTD